MTLTKRERVLERLKQGPALGNELQRIHWRFGASIYDLRKAGWDIVTELVEGETFRYTLRGWSL